MIFYKFQTLLLDLVTVSQADGAHIYFLRFMGSTMMFSIKNRGLQAPGPWGKAPGNSPTYFLS